MHVPGTRRHAALALAALLLLLSAGLVQPAAGLRTAQPSNISYWGMNLYLTKGERRINNRDNLAALAALAQQSGMRWTREELPWDLIEPYNNTFISAYDSRLKQAADSGFGIIGMLLTTPAWARDPACRPEVEDVYQTQAYWCAPADVQEYAQWAGWMAERYDGDGYADAPGSPRIAAWQIWNEQNHYETWPLLGYDPNTRIQRYGEMLVAAYQAIKAADPSATVVTGGVYVFDGSVGLKFMGDVFRLVPAAGQAFDVFAIHPFMPTAAPDQPGLVRIVTLEGRIQNTHTWLNNDVGRPSAPIWISEVGWCAEPGFCAKDPNSTVPLETQANYLMRAMVIAQQNGVQHTSWFQFEDAFDGTTEYWGHAAIVENYNGTSYPPRPAFYAYQTLATWLGDATPVGPGPLHTHTYNANDPYGRNDGGSYDYRYVLGSTTIDVLWRPEGSQQVAFPIEPDRYVRVLDRSGADITASTNGGSSLTLSESPILVIQQSTPPVPPQLQVAPGQLLLLTQYTPGSSAVTGALRITNAGEGMLSWSASTSTPWLSLSAQSGVAPASVQVTGSSGGRAVGSYQGSISITGSNGRQVTLPVELRVVERLYRLYLPIGRR